MRSFQKFCTVVSLGILCFFCFQQLLDAKDWDQVLEAARREVKVVASIPSSPVLRKGMGKAFEVRFPGIDREPVPGRGSRNVKRITDPPMICRNPSGRASSPFTLRAGRGLGVQPGSTCGGSKGKSISSA